MVHALKFEIFVENHIKKETNKNLVFSLKTRFIQLQQLLPDLVLLLLTCLLSLNYLAVQVGIYLQLHRELENIAIQYITSLVG